MLHHKITKSLLLTGPILLGVLTLCLAACRPALLDPPRLAQATLAAATPAPEEAAVIYLAAPTSTGPPIEISDTPDDDIQLNPTLVFWGLQSTKAEADALESIVADFTADNAVNVELYLVEPQYLPGLMHNVVVSAPHAMPHVVMLPLEYSAGWLEQGILDSRVATELVTALDPATFDPGALALAESEGGYVAVPSDGWQQLLVYRQDWFDERNLSPPSDYEAMLTAGQTISNSAELVFGFNMPTESSLPATTRAFEQLALANGCQLIDERGELQVLAPACQEALEFYRSICNSYCPPGVQTEVSTSNAYLSGLTGMIMTSPAMLTKMAGLEPQEVDACPECDSQDYLARNSGIVTQIAGKGPEAAPANLGNITYLGVTSAADQEVASAFVRFWFEEGYETWLASRPEMKVPMRRGTTEEPERFIEEWFTFPLRPDSPTLQELYGEEIAGRLVNGVVNPDRWGFGNGQGVLVSEVYENLMFSILLQELLSGYYGSDRAAIEGYKRLVDLIPNYAFYVDPEPTPKPDN